VIVDLIDGTYELFRYHFAMGKDGSRTAATRGVLGGVLAMLDRGTTHVGVATDHVIESFRNNLWPGYKTSAGMPEELLVQFPLIEEALAALGVTVWPMVDVEADDALASAAAALRDEADVEQVKIHTVDKDLSQCVVDSLVVQVDRRKDLILDEAGVIQKYGVAPESIPDWLALVGDSADGFPGISGWGKATASSVLGRYRHLEDIPVDGLQWDVRVRGQVALARTLVENLKLVLLFRDLATLRTEPPVVESADELRWNGPTPEFAAVCERVGAPNFVARAEALASR
jgi:5'-3' exonuclease